MSNSTNLTGLFDDDINLKGLFDILSPENNLVLADDMMLSDAEGIILRVSENYEKNCQTAQELMQEAGYTADVLERLEQVVMLYESDGTTDSLAVFLQKTWREKLGIQVTLRGVSASEITKALEQGEYTLAALWVTSDRNDATGFLNRWRTDNEGNYANFNSSAYDMLLGVASVSASKEARDAYLEDAERLLLEKGNVIPLYHSTRSWSLSEKYTGLFGDGLGRYFFAGIHAVSK